MCRPKGSIDKKKRKRKIILTGTQERDLIKDYEEGVKNSDLYKKYGITKSTLSSIKKRRNIASKINHNEISLWTEITDFSKIKNTSGVYAIYFIWNYNKTSPDKHKLVNDIKIYIGSSVSMGDRLSAHENELKNNKHYNKNLQNLYNNNKYSVCYAIIEECGIDSIMQRECWHLNKYSFLSLLNYWKPVKEENIRPWLEKAITKDTYIKNFIWSNDQSYNGSACKETLTNHKSGYGRMDVTVNGERKYFTKHRVAYWEKHGDYPELVRHLCNNARCYNSDHLAKGTHRDNMLDRRGSFPEEFEQIWLEYRGELHKISEYFKQEGRWNPNQSWNGKKVSYSVYDWEKKLDLRNKYPEISKKRISKLRKKQAKKKAKRDSLASTFN